MDILSTMISLYRLETVLNKQPHKKNSIQTEAYYILTIGEKRSHRIILKNSTNKII